MLWRRLDMLWRTTCICCGWHTCSPQHMFLMLSTTCHPQAMSRVFSTTCTPCSPQYITCAPQPIILTQKWPPPYSKNAKIYVVRVSILDTLWTTSYIACGWQTICCGVHRLWVTICCGYRTYIVGICCGQHPLVVYVVGDDMLWVTVF